MTAQRTITPPRVGDVYEKRHDGRVFVVTEIRDGYATVVDEGRGDRHHRISLYALLERLRARTYSLVKRGQVPT